MKFKCPVCSKSNATQIANSSDFYSSQGNREIWQCENCDNIFIIEFDITRIINLKEEE